MLHYALIVWFVLTGLSVVYVAWDALTRNPELTVMKYGWVLVTLYAGPVAAAFYVLSCQEPGPYQHEEFIKPLWKQALGSTVHCLAGDATGVIFAAATTATLGLPVLRLPVVPDRLVGHADRRWRRICFWVRLWAFDFSGAVHARHVGWILCGRGAAFLRAGMALDERGDGGHDPGHGLADDPRHAGDGADLDLFLGDHLPPRDIRGQHPSSSQCLAGRGGIEARHGKRARAWPWRSRDASGSHAYS